MDGPRPASKSLPTLAVVVAVLLLIAAGGVAWRFLAGEGGGSRELAARSATGGRGDAAMPSAEPATTSLEGAHGPSRDADPVATESSATTDPAAAALAKHGIDVHAVFEDGEPAAGAQIVVVDRSRVKFGERPALIRDQDELRGRALVRTTAETTGSVRVPWRPTGVFVFGFAGERRGCIEIAPSTLTPQRLELLRKRDVVVRVVDVEQMPQVGIEVALFESRADATLSEALQSATTGSDGRATIADVDLEVSYRRAGASARPEFAAGFPFPLRPLVTAPVDFDRPPEPPLTLTLPATGSLAFQVVDEKGEPLATAGSLTVEGLHLRTDEKTTGGELPSAAVAIDAHGSGRLARIGLGLVGQANPELLEYSSRTVAFAGPTSAGETVAISVPANAIGPIVTGHALDADGRPLAAMDLITQIDRFDVTKSGALAGTSSASTKLDEDGAFRLDYSSARFRGDFDSSMQLWLRAHRGTEGERSLFVEARLDLALPERGVIDVGRVKFAPPPQIAAGVVVDEDGSPVEAAAVIVTSDAKSPPPFHAFHDPPATTDVQGRFELVGEVPEGRLSLRAAHGGYLRMKPVPINAGATDVTLVLRIGGEVDGSVRFPDGFASNLLKVRGTLGDVQQVQSVRPDGTFQFTRLPTGPWNFELLLGRGDNTERILTANLVTVRPAEATFDPRLQQIDLAALLHFVDVAVRVPGGDFAEGGAVGRSWNSDGNRRSLSVPLKEGRALVPCPTVPVTLQVVVPGFMAHSVRATDAPVDVLLRRGYPLRLQVHGGLAKFPDLVALRITANPRDDAIASVGPAPSGALEDGVATLVVPSTGRYRARIEFGTPPEPDVPPEEMRRRDRRAARSDVDFEVKDVDAEQVVDLKVKG